MKFRIGYSHIRIRLIALGCVCMAILPAFAVQVEPLISSGLSSPVFVGNAGDGSNRLFVAERGGIVRVLQPGASNAAVFLDIRDRLAPGNEKGLLGLAFHPRYATNGRFFAYYTRASDDALVLAEYSASSNVNIAAPTEDVVLAITHPRQANHLGGMLAFGADGYLYLAVGDGAIDNDPLGHAQDIDVLLGKLLRIDVDHPDTATGTRYSSPVDNPFVGAPGRDEIYATGFRNPWRFSFDRATGRAWVADVGLQMSEEVDSPVVRGGNYGWRIYEGTSCTNNDSALCNPASYLPPVSEYGHALGRCSITGGYVYRGSRGALPAGTYVYGDFCSGEIFAWNGSTQTVLLHTAMNIVSFGEDEQGELYVVDFNGSIGRIAADAAATISSAVEFYHAEFDHYFITASGEEIAKLDAGVFGGWARTGEAFNVYPVGAADQVNTCRFFSTSFAPKSSHFYTPIAGECAIVKRNPDWQFEGEVFSVKLPDGEGRCPTDTRSLYRLYNNGQGAAPNHRYTISLGTRSMMLVRGWIPEGEGPLGTIACVPL